MNILSIIRRWSCRTGRHREFGGSRRVVSTGNNFWINRDRTAGCRVEKRVAERSMPPSVRPGIRLSVHAPAGLPCGSRRMAWTCTDEGSPFHPFSALIPRWVNSPLLCRRMPFAPGSRARGMGGGGAVSFRGGFSASCRSHRGGGDATARTSSVGRRGLVAVPEPAVSRSGVSPVTCPAVGGRSSRARRCDESAPSRRGGRALSATDRSNGRG